jgi:2'-5' RNA ligase
LLVEKLMWRLFIAIFLPEEIKTRLAEAQRALQRRMPGGVVRWTPLEQVHLTLRFLGDVPEESVPVIVEAMRRASASVPPFALRAAALGCFPDERRPRVLWAGVAGDLAGLHHLQASIVAGTASWGQHEDRSFHGHLTLGRIKDGVGREASRIGTALMEEAARDFGEWRVNSVMLLRSELSPAGARHSVLADSILSPVGGEVRLDHD